MGILELERAVSKDIAQGMSAPQARLLVDYYYSVQDYRIRAHSQLRAVEQETDDGVTTLITALGSTMADVEHEIAYALGHYARAHRAGRWALGITGIGPIITAGLLGHIDIHKAPTAGSIWRYAGMDPTAKWEKGQRRPHNAELKVLCWKIGDSFVKNKNRDGDDYGKLYAERKALEVERNEAGLFAETARETLAAKNFKDNDTKKWYERDMLPPGRIDFRARRYAIKLFLSHFHWVLFEDTFGKPPPDPYVIAHMNHAHLMKPPKWPVP